MKARLAFADVVAEAACLHDMLVGGRLINIYDCDDKTFVLKFSRPHAADSIDDSDRDKVFVLIESGVRVHSSGYVRSHADSPSGFVAKLRKHVRGWRCTDICVRGLDRLLDFAFGWYHIIVELYDRGNVILCEATPHDVTPADPPQSYLILSLLRTYTLGAGETVAGEVGDADVLRVAARQMYPLGPPLRELLNGYFTGAVAQLEPRDGALSLTLADDVALGAAIGLYLNSFMARPDIAGKKKRKLDLATCLMWKGSGLDVYGGALIEDALVEAGLPPNARMEDITLPEKNLNAPLLARIAGRLRSMPAKLQALASVPTPAYAYVRVRDDASAEAAAGPLAAALSTSTAATSTGDEPPLPVAGCLGTWAEFKSHPRVARREEHAFDFIDFTPARFAQYAADGDAPYIIFDSFDALCDAVFSRTDVARAVKVETAARTAAMKRVEKVKEGTKEAISALTQAQEHALTCARLIESHSASVDAVCAIVRSALSSGMDWGTFTRIIAAEAAGGNACARMIVKTDMKSRGVTVALTDESAFAEVDDDGDDEQQKRDEDDDDEDDESDDAPGPLPSASAAGGDASTAAEPEPDHSAAAAATSTSDAQPKRSMAASSRTQREALSRSRARAKLQARKAAARAAKATVSADDATVAPTGAVHVDLNVDVSAHANAGVYYEAAKRAVVKMEKTAETGAHALKRAEKSVSSSGSIVSVSSIIKVARKPAWYERFAWFISSEGYIVIAGRNAHDNEALVKRYLRPCDVYVHADIHGAATVIVRNVKRSGDASYGAIPPHTLSQAGSFCVCLSAAWNAHIPTSAWWVSASQVSKTAPTGEYLGTGSFMIRGRKNVLPHSRLELGLCVLFRVDDTCIARHAGDRYIRGRLVEELPEEGEVEDLPLPVGGHEAADEADEDADSADEVEGDAEAAEAVVAETASTSTSGVPVPAHIRKRAKRLETVAGLDAASALARAWAEHVDKPAPVAAPPAPAPVAAPVAKKESKFKSKRRAKYADQDDDDRAQAEAVIGHAFVPAPAAAPVATTAAPHPLSDAASKSKGAKAAAAAAAKALEAEDDDAPVRMDDDADTAGVAALVGVPHPDDVLLHAFTMLCPYSVALECKYRVKLVPGALKKGKAARSAMEAFVSQAGAFARARPGSGVSATAREKDLLRALSEPETITTILGNVRVAAAAAFAGTSSAVASSASASASGSSGRRAAGGDVADEAGAE